MGINQGRGVGFAVPHCAKAQKHLPFGCCALRVIWKHKYLRIFEKQDSLVCMPSLGSGVSKTALQTRSEQNCVLNN